MTQTILVVDDSANVRTLVREYLTAEGFRVVTANDGLQALFAARDEKPDLILLDIMMPEMTALCEQQNLAGVRPTELSLE